MAVSFQRWGGESESCDGMSGDCQLADVRDVARLEWAHLVVFQRQQGNGVAVVTNKLHLEPCALAMHQHGGADVAPLYARVWANRTLEPQRPVH